MKANGLRKTQRIEAHIDGGYGGVIVGGGGGGLWYDVNGSVFIIGAQKIPVCVTCAECKCVA